MTLAAFCGLALMAAGALAAIMAGAWAAQRLTGQSGWIDAIWTFGVGATGVALALARFELLAGVRLARGGGRDRGGSVVAPARTAYRRKNVASAR